MEIPSVYDVDAEFFEFISGKDGSWVSVDASEGLITVG
jgi:hypothetical protein